MIWYGDDFKTCLPWLDCYLPLTLFFSIYTLGSGLCVINHWTIPRVPCQLSAQVFRFCFLPNVEGLSPFLKSLPTLLWVTLFILLYVSWNHVTHSQKGSTVAHRFVPRSDILPYNAVITLIMEFLNSIYCSNFLHSLAAPCFSDSSPPKCPPSLPSCCFISNLKHRRRTQLIIWQSEGSWIN